MDAFGLSQEGETLLAEGFNETYGASVTQEDVATYIAEVNTLQTTEGTVDADTYAFFAPMIASDTPAKSGYSQDQINAYSTQFADLQTTPAYLSSGLFTYLKLLSLEIKMHRG